MKEYGASKATEFTKKQIGVIYSLAKKGDLKVERWIISDLYDLAEYYGYDDNGTVEDSERKILKILENVFAGNINVAQELINDYTIDKFERLSLKNKKSVDRSVMS